jgi:hypothetical protein
MKEAIDSRKAAINKLNPTPLVPALAILARIKIAAAETVITPIVKTIPTRHFFISTFSLYVRITTS